MASFRPPAGSKPQTPHRCNCGNWGACERALPLAGSPASVVYNPLQRLPSENMHIPDGYLSPSTCAVLYAGAGVGWYGALRRIRRTLTARMVPLISVFAAFSFVLMMFNLRSEEHTSELQSL